MKINELRHDVAELKREIKLRESAYRLTGAHDPLFEKELDYLKSIAKGRKSTKKDLLLYKQEAAYFLDWDITSPPGLKTASKREQKAYRTFKKHTGINLSYHDWRHLVTMLGTLGSDALEMFGYGEGKAASGSLAEAYKAAKKAGTDQDFLSAAIKVLKKSKTEDFEYSKTPSGLLEALWHELGAVAEEDEAPKSKRGRKRKK